MNLICRKRLIFFLLRKNAALNLLANQDKRRHFFTIYKLFDFFSNNPPFLLLYAGVFQKSFSALVFACIRMGTGLADQLFNKLTQHLGRGMIGYPVINLFSVSAAGNQAVGPQLL